MMRWSVILMVVLIGVGCSQEKDAFLNRTYHKLTARDNGWFNANEKLKEVVLGIEDAHFDDFDEVLPMFVYGTDDQARNAIPELEKCIDKCSLVIERHSMDIKGEEKNAWIDDAWFVIAKSNFYKRNYYEAERGFSYISRRFKGENRQFESMVWLARTAIQMEHFAKAQSALDNVRGEKKLPKHFDHAELSAVQVELELKRGKVDDAIIHLEHAVSIVKRKRERVRWAFILAQLYEMKGQEEKAIKQYAAVVKMGPPYELAFHAQINQALAFSKGSTKVLRQKLNRMLRDDKHVDHFDMIHYALADLDLKDRDKPSAIDQLVTSSRVSTTDTRQKAKSWMKLADLYFDDRIYASAQKYYDSTRTLLNEEHERYEEVVTRADVLGELVEQLAIVALEDSLQELSGLDEKELEKRVRGMIRDREKEEADKETAEAEARALAESDPGIRPSTPAPRSGGQGNWYFYDPQQISRGSTDFRKQWGGRKNEDGWRRKDKSGSALAESVEEEGLEMLEETIRDKGKGGEDWRELAYYTRDLPKDDIAIEASNGRICSALYICGMIYKEQLKDTDNAIESFENLNSRFDECQYTAESYYQLYRIYLEKEQVENYFAMDGMGSEFYANIILERYPDSEFARLVRDPNILQADEARRLLEEVAYKEVYDRYRSYMYSSVVVSCERVIQDEPLNHYLAKYHMLRAMAIGGLRDGSGFRNALAEIRDKFPGTDEAKAAQDLLAALDRSSGASPSPPGSTDPSFKQDQGKHYFALIVPNEGNDMNTIKTRLSDFNNAYFHQAGMEFTNNFLDPEHQIILASFFTSKVKAMNFYDLFKNDQNALSGLNDQDYPAFAISPENYSELFKSKDVDSYSAFFTANYLGGQ